MPFEFQLLLRSLTLDEIFSPRDAQELLPNAVNVVP
jgi:hypothetical protein